MDRQREKSPLGRCDECSLKPYGYVPMQRPSDRQYRVLWIGQAPGSTEVITGVPFTGPAGKMLWRLMKHVGIDKPKQTITNVVACAPPNDREPKPKEIECCSQRLKTEIYVSQPELIVALGEVAMNVLTGRTSIKKHHGQFWPLDPKWDYACPVLCLFHPSFVMRQRQWIDTAVKDLSMVPRFFENALRITDEDNPLFILNPSVMELTDILTQWRDSKRWITFDIGTPEELNPRKASVISIAFSGDHDTAVAIDLFGNHEAQNVVKHFLEDEDVQKVAQNAQFDVAVLAENRARVKGLVFDTRLAEHILSSELPADLDTLRNKYTHVKPYKPSSKEMRSIKHWSPEQRLTYNCWDALVTWRVAQEQAAIMDDDDWYALNNIDIPLIEVVNYMEHKGIRIDVLSLFRVSKKIAFLLTQLEEKRFEPQKINPNSNVHIKKLLNVKHVDNSSLKKYFTKGGPHKKFIEDLLEYRRLKKVYTVYLKEIIRRLESDRIHARFNIASSGTGRLSSVNPNLQNVPHEIRVLYVPDSSNHCWIEGRYDQLELRILTVLANETHLLDEINSDNQIINEKELLFGVVEGRTARSLAMEFHMSIKAIEAWQEKIFDKYPKLKEYREKQIGLSKVRTAFGRRCSAQNVLRSSAGDVIKLALIDLYKAGADVRITVDDSILIQARKDEVSGWMDKMKEIMEQPIGRLNNYQFPVKLATGTDWYSLKPVGGKT